MFSIGSVCFVLRRHRELRVRRMARALAPSFPGTDGYASMPWCHLFGAVKHKGCFFRVRTDVVCVFSSSSGDIPRKLAAGLLRNATYICLATFLRRNKFNNLLHERVRRRFEQVIRRAILVGLGFFKMKVVPFISH